MSAILKSDYKLIDGIKCYSTTATKSNTDYNPEHYDVLFNIESNNFWFRSRNRLIKYLISKFIDSTTNAKVLEFGCGTGYVLKGLSEFKNLKLYGAELNLEGLRYAKKRLPEVEFIQLDMRASPFESEFDVVCAFDVLEHIDDDELIIKNVYKTLKTNGFFFISVPQHMWLWSTQDETAYHKRRYSRKEMITKLTEAGFSIEFQTSFVFTLLPIMFLSRFRRKKKPTEKEIKYSYDELILPPVLNKIVEFFMLVDELLIRLGLSLPIGGSLFLVAKKGI